MIDSQILQLSEAILLRLPKTRDEARDKKFKHYYSRKECKHGHLAARIANSDTCVQCKADMHKEYQVRKKNNGNKKGKH